MARYQLRIIIIIIIVRVHVQEQPSGTQNTQTS